MSKDGVDRVGRRRVCPFGCGGRLVAALAICLSSAMARGQSLDVDQSGPPVDAFTDLTYVGRRLLALPPVPPSFRALDPGIPPDEEIAARVDAIGNALDVDADGTVDPFTDLVYCTRTLFGLAAVPPDFRVIDPSIPSDMDIAARCAALTSAATPSAT